MIYLKVKPEYDNFRQPNGDIFIGNELYTIREFEKIRYDFLRAGKGTVQLKNIFDQVVISRKDTYFFFGARFQKEVE